MRRPTNWSLSLLLIVLGCSLIAFPQQRADALLATTAIAAAALVGSGLLLFIRRPFTFWVALAAGLLTILLAGASPLLNRQLVPMPWLTAVIGVLVTLRVLLAQSLERRTRERQLASGSDEDAPDPRV